MGVLALLLTAPLFLVAAEPEADPKDLPRIPPVEPKDALKTFAVKPGFRLELVAAEPLLRDPIEICFDENGRMFVVEMIDYSELRDAKPHLGRIRRLEDTNGDGVFDRSTVFADDLPWPTGVFCYGGGVYAAATPDIFFLKDTDGDGKADWRQLVFTGFAKDYAPYRTNQLNMQAMLNSFRWGLDNRIHGLTAPNGGEVTSPLHPQAKPVNLRGRDFLFDPRTQAISAEAGGGQYGMSYDDRGRRFTCNNSDHLRVFMYELRYAGRNPYYALPPPLESIAADGPAAEVYRRSPDEPWRVLRTRWRVSGLVPGPIEGGGRASGYFTSATGLMIYRGHAWPEEYVGDAFIADCGSNLIHRKKLRPQGVALLGERPKDEERTEFLTSTDIWFRPVQMANAPDGALYIVDMYREIIEHPWSLPPAIKKHLDLNAGNDRGRVYRVVPENFKQPPLPSLGSATTEALVRTLAHPNAWHRETAARLLYERQDRAQAVPALEDLLKNSTAPLGRLHALYALDGQGALRAEHVLRHLEDADERVREHAVRLAEKFLPEPSPAAPRLQKKLLEMTADPSAHVRYQLAFTLGEFDHPDRIRSLAALARLDAAGRWNQAALLSSAGDGAAALFQILAADPGFTVRPEGQDFLRQLARVLGARNRANEIGQVLDFVERTADQSAAFAVAHAFSEGIQRSRAPVARERLQPVFRQAGLLATNAAAAEPVRVQAIQLLGLTSFAEAGGALLGLLNLEQPQGVQLAALATLGRFSDPQIAPALLDRWPSFTPRLREEALVVLLARPDRALALLQTVAEGKVRLRDLSSNQIMFLMNHRDAKVKQMAIKLFQTASLGKREDVLKEYLPALNLAGNAARGKPIFTERCASCHRLGGEGFVLGPDLVSARNSGKEKMLASIIDPNKEVLPQYVAFEIETRDDESFSGLVINETAANVTLRQAYGKEPVIMRKDIARMRSTGQSIMPEALEANLKPQDLADLLEYLLTAEEPGK